MVLVGVRTAWRSVAEVDTARHQKVGEMQRSDPIPVSLVLRSRKDDISGRRRSLDAGRKMTAKRALAGPTAEYVVIRSTDFQCFALL